LAEGKNVINELYDHPIVIDPPTVQYDESIMYPALTGPIAEGMPVNTSLQVILSLEHEGTIQLSRYPDKDSFLRNYKHKQI